ncbi:MAG: anaerobic glycerol-3-phosphate dehydrogenase subunit A [Hyphomicrobiales bacterium]|nr:MAG: anaerobic glycerol-3-phosphate dehydrogenase subunit A [Hyphomicrobiales bacterium]
MTTVDPAGTRTLQTEVLIIGGGVTGTGIMRDLALRGISSLLIDRRDLNAGASGGNHGLLHSGGRYAVADTETATECRQEGDLLKKLAPQCVEPCGGLFVAVEGDDPSFVDKFRARCHDAGIECEQLTPSDACELEPSLSEKTFAAFTVPDATVDPFRLTLEAVNHARTLTDSRFLAHTEVVGFDIADGAIKAALCRDTRTGEQVRIEAGQVVNASGAWAMHVARLAGCEDITLLYSKGTLIISNTRISDRVVNRLRLPGDGDILVPGGTVSLLGTTSDNIDGLDDIRPTVSEVERVLNEGAAMVPVLADTRFIRAFSGVRPLLMAPGAGADGRKASRGFQLFDHEDQGLANFATVSGGKLTTFRLMAEKTCDLVARRLGNGAPCRTAEEPLPSGDAVRWTEPGFAPRYWFKRNDPTDMILCECEMVPQSAIDSIVEAAPGAEDHMSLQAISVRSRIGKGSCQGAFCGIRVTSHLYDRGVYDTSGGLVHLRDFVAERFKGVKPVLWGRQMPQSELAEAIHCGLMGLDRLEDEPPAAGDDTAEDRS